MFRMFRYMLAMMRGESLKTHDAYFAGAISYEEAMQQFRKQGHNIPSHW